jgi:peroxiredoxin
MWWLLAGLLQAAEVPAPNLKVGDTAFQFSLPAVNEDVALKTVVNTQVTLSAFLGIQARFPARAVVVTFVEGITGADQLAALQRLQKKYASKSVRFLMVVMGSSDIATLSDWVSTQKADIPVLNDRYRIVSERYGVHSSPMTFVIDGDGYVDAIGTASGTLEPELDAILSDLLQ